MELTVEARSCKTFFNCKKKSKNNSEKKKKNPWLNLTEHFKAGICKLRKKSFSLIHDFGNSYSNSQPHTNTKILMGLFSY